MKCWTFVQFLLPKNQLEWVHPIQCPLSRQLNALLTPTVAAKFQMVTLVMYALASDLLEF